MRRALAGLVVILVASCSNPPRPKPPPKPENRCELDLAGYTSNVGKSARARKVESAQDLLPGEAARGRLGDFRLENDKVRVVIQAPDRHMQPNPYGGALIDAALAKDGATDGFGKLALLYSFGRTQRATNVSVLQSGEGGGAAIVVADGVDALNDAIHLQTTLGELAPGKRFIVDPDAPTPLTLSTYYVLNPGESRVRVITALCNEGESGLDLAVGDLVDPAPGTESFQPGGCGDGAGWGSDCQVSEMSWIGYQGDAVAYGYAPCLPGSSEPSLHNERLALDGLAITVLGATQSRNALDALLDWTDPNIKQRDGTLHVPAGGTAVLSRDLVIGRDLGEVASLVATYRNSELRLPMGDLKGTVKAGSQPVAGARVALEQDVGGKRIEQAVFVTDADGAWAGHFVAGDYFVSAWAPGSLSTAPIKVVVQAAGTATQDLDLQIPRTLTVEVRDLAGTAIPAKVTVFCEAGACPEPRSALARFIDVSADVWADDVAAVGFAGPSGSVDLWLQPAKYRLVVSRGPAWSTFPTTWRPDDISTGLEVDLTTADSTVTAALAKVIDSAGWLATEASPRSARRLKTASCRH
ncbi:MAG: carboxypeptidase-like regulatory domain-containing protein [Myxococcales bacterium]